MRITQSQPLSNSERKSNEPQQNAVGIVAVETEEEIANSGTLEAEGGRDARSREEPVDVTAAISEVLAEIGAVKKYVAELTARDDLFAQLHQRLTEQSEEFFTRRFVEPLTRKIAALDHRIREQLAYLKSIFEAIPRSVWEQVPQYWSHGALNGIRIDLESILSDLGVELFVTVGDRFDRSVHEAVRRVSTSEIQKVGGIAQRIAPGFRLGGKIIVPERVAVFVKDAATG